MNEIQIDDEIASWAISAALIKAQLSQMSGDVTVYVNSIGGSIFEGIEIFNTFLQYKKGKVTFVITGVAASIASYIVLSGDELKVYDNATYMIHNAWTFAAGDANKLKKTAEILDGLSSIMAKKYAEKTGKTIEEIKNMMDKESYFYGEEIVLEGFATELLSTNNTTTKDEAIALNRESFKASCLNAKEKYNDDEFVQSVAKLVKEVNFLNDVSDVTEPNAAILNEEQYQHRLRLIEIEKRKVI
ncbi:head maturation protease, ClpP-related [Aliarcobacter butzleri]|uniref:head maturation protease, ClpP-related n=1 Tax=Aliarcobacter butzleri TaxID=28197 RepID=UPI00125F215C|nr:head maturation protease, ClpP-related [Aliarcobacter butzleri]